MNKEQTKNDLLKEFFDRCIDKGLRIHEILEFGHNYSNYVIEYADSILKKSA